MTGSTASPRSAARHARINMRAAASELVTSTRIRFIDPSPAQRNTLRAEVRDQPFHRRKRIRLLGFVRADMPMVTLAGFVVVADERLAAAPEIQPVLQAVRPIRRYRRKLPQ